MAFATERRPAAANAFQISRSQELPYRKKSRAGDVDVAPVCICAWSRDQNLSCALIVTSCGSSATAIQEGIDGHLRQVRHLPYSLIHIQTRSGGYRPRLGFLPSRHGLTVERSAAGTDSECEGTTAWSREHVLRLLSSVVLRHRHLDVVQRRTTTKFKQLSVEELRSEVS